MTRTTLLTTAGCFTALAIAAFSGAVAAQDSAEQAAPTAEDAPICMSRPLSDVKQVSREKHGQPFRILTTERTARGLEAKGFTRVDCVTADLVQADKKNAWRDEICELAATGNEAVQNQLEKAYGERPAVLCTGAEMAAGMWEGRNKPKSKPRSEE
ncbi:hypothetical protein [Pontixanthobacter sp. CEM42]|uniref:hypothetical protein n=1 Tax=Pontixanthobacter sp. CEM42 TaxID=2792077 RepID=UPI001ADFA9F6|nr:hypothetical protein [Pontixanthobacter sp. CEM42]